MTFLSPWMLLGLLGVAAPVAAHLLSRQASRTVVFPTIKLLAQTKAGTSRLYRIRRGLLLSLRVLALMLVVLAFAQPIWLGARTGHSAVGDARTVVVLLDASGSMRRQANGMTTFDQARAALGRTLDGLRPGIDRVAVVVTPQVLADAPARFTTNPAAVRTALNGDASGSEGEGTSREASETASGGAADWPSALRRVNALLEGARPGATVVLLSDFSPDALLPSNAAADATWPRLPFETRLITPKLTPPAPSSNVGLSGPQAAPAQPRVGQPVALNVTARNFGPSPVVGQVIATTDGRVIGRERVTLAANSGALVRFDHALPAIGDFGVTFTWRPDADQPLDALPLDDQVHLALRSQAAPVALILHGSPTGSRRLSAHAVAPEAAQRFQQALAAFGDARDSWQVRTQSISRLAPIEIAQADVVILTGDPLPEPDAAAEVADELREHLLAGGGLIVASTAAELTSWLARLTGKGHPVERQLASGDSAWSVTPALAADSPLSSLSDEAIDSLTRLAITRRQAFADSAQLQPWLTYDDGKPLIAQAVADTPGKVLVLTTQPDRASGNLAQHPLFVTLAQRLTQAAHNSASAPPIAHVAGQSLALPVAPRQVASNEGETPPADAGRWRMQAPDGSTMPVQLSVTGRGVRVITPVLHATGFYRVLQGNRLAGLVAVNPDPVEGDLSVTPFEQVRAALLAVDDRQNTSIGETSPRVAELDAALAASGIPLWPACVLLALMLMGVEMAIVRRWPR